MEDNFKLQAIIRYLSSETNSASVEIIHKIIFSRRDKEGIAKLANMDSNIDYALPMDYINKIKEAFPEFNDNFFVMSYKDNCFGQLVNLAEAALLNIFLELDTKPYEKHQKTLDHAGV